MDKQYITRDDLKDSYSKCPCCGYWEFDLVYCHACGYYVTSVNVIHCEQKVEDEA